MENWGASATREFISLKPKVLQKFSILNSKFSILDYIPLPLWTIRTSQEGSVSDCGTLSFFVYRRRCLHLFTFVNENIENIENIIRTCLHLFTFLNENIENIENICIRQLRNAATNNVETAYHIYSKYCSLYIIIDIACYIYSRYYSLYSNCCNTTPQLLLGYIPTLIYNTDLELYTYL